MMEEGVIPGEPQAREGDPPTGAVLWIPFPLAMHSSGNDNPHLSSPRQARSDRLTFDQGGLADLQDGQTFQFTRAGGPIDRLSEREPDEGGSDRRQH